MDSGIAAINEEQTHIYEIYTHSMYEYILS